MSEKTEKVTFEHFRLPISSDWPKKGEPDVRFLIPYSPGKTSWTPHPRGGATICTLKNGSGTFVGMTLASMSQNFEYDEGQKKSKRRARMQQQLTAARERSFYDLIF